MPITHLNAASHDLQEAVAGLPAPAEFSGAALREVVDTTSNVSEGESETDEANRVHILDCSTERNNDGNLR